MDITDLRKQIDDVDKALVQLFSQRMDIAANIARYKQEHGLPVFVPAREKEVLIRVSERSRPDLRGYTSRLYSMLFELSRCYQNEQLSRSSTVVSGTQENPIDTDKLTVSMILPTEEDVLFKVIAKQSIHGIKITSMKFESITENKATLTMAIDNTSPSDQLSAFLHELKTMSETFTVSDGPSEVAP